MNKFMFNSDEGEVVAFNERNQKVLVLLPKFADLMNSILNQVAELNDSGDAIIYMLARLCKRHYESIYLLCLHDHGYSAMRVLRSLFEKYTDALYLNKNPDEVMSFIEYEFVQLKKMGLTDFAKKLDPKFHLITDKFKRKKPPKGTWAKKDLVSRAKEVGADDFMIRHAYTLPNAYIHTSISEIIESTVIKNDEFFPNELNNKTEQTCTDRCFVMATNIMIGILFLQLDHFKLKNRQELDEFSETFTKSYDAIVQNKSVV